MIPSLPTSPTAGPASSSGHAPLRRGTKPTKYTFTPVHDDLIRQTYREKQVVGKNHVVGALAKRLGYPMWAVSRRALQLGVRASHIKEPVWSDAELHILELNAMLSPEVIQRKLRAQGYTRSVAAVNLKRKRLHLRQQQVPCSAHAVAECFGIDRHAVLRWIEKGLLKASKKGTKRENDEWHIEDRHIRQFIVENVGIIDIRKVDKVWFVELLTGEAGV